MVRLTPKSIWNKKFLKLKETCETEIFRQSLKLKQSESDKELSYEAEIFREYFCHRNKQIVKTWRRFENINFRSYLIWLEWPKMVQISAVHNFYWGWCWLFPWGFLWVEEKNNFFWDFSGLPESVWSKPSFLKNLEFKSNLRICRRKWPFFKYISST